MIIISSGLISCRKPQEPSSIPASSEQSFVCPMHAQVTSTSAGRCSICGMDLVVHSAAPPSDAPIQLSAETEQRIGLTTSLAEKRSMTVTVRAAAHVVNDLTLMSAIEDYQNSYRAYQTAQNNPPAAPQNVPGGYPTGYSYPNDQELRYKSAKTRLQQIGIDEKSVQDIARLGNFGVNGTLKWVYADIFDYEVALVKPGQRVSVVSPAYPGKSFSGDVIAMDSSLDRESHTLRVRVAVRDPQNDLRAEMAVNALIKVPLGVRLCVPESAVMDTGVRQMVFVSKGVGRYEPREVTVGRQADGYFEIIKGLSPGESVVTSANFLLDSESKLRTPHSS